MSLVKADDACPQVRFGVSIIPTDVRDGSISDVLSERQPLLLCP